MELVLFLLLIWWFRSLLVPLLLFGLASYALLHPIRVLSQIPLFVWVLYGIPVGIVALSFTWHWIKYDIDHPLPKEYNLLPHRKDCGCQTCRSQRLPPPAAA